MPPRLKDIANDLNLSVITISKVLRGHPDIGPQTRERVLQRMKELNYRPNLAARTLLTGRTYAIGLIVPDLVHPFFGELAKALSRVLRNTNYSLVLSSSDDDPQLEQQEIDNLLSRRVDVLVVASVQSDGEVFRRIQEHTPVVLIDRRFDGFATHFVGTDDIEAGRIATEHLLEVGCRHLAHIGGPDVSTAMGRLRGYREVLARMNVQERPGTVLLREHGDDAGERSGYDGMRRLLELRPRPDGVFCYNDPTAMGAMKAVVEAGLRVPEDVAVVGCGNVAYADFLRIPLTSVDQQSAEIGQRAAKLALSLLDEPPKRAKKYVLAPKLVERASTHRSRHHKQGVKTLSTPLSRARP